MDTADTAEPDEFARLLAQLNGTTEPEPAVAAPQAIPPAPVFTPPPAPAMPAPAGAPAPVAPPVAQAPVAQAPIAQAPVAPAFGVTTPYPPYAATQATPPAPAGPAPLSFPTVAPMPAAVPPVAPTLPRAPELMGADELAAPPGAFPPVSDPLPPLVSPPDYPAPPLTAAGLPPESVPAYESPLPAVPQQAAPFVSAPALFPPESAAPVAPVSSAPAAPLAPASPSIPQTSRAPLDFASLLATPVGADDDAAAASAALRFGSSSSGDDDDEPDIGRSTTAEKIGLALAVLVAPIGLIAGIVAAVRSAQRRGWVVGIVRASIAIASVLTVALGIGGYYEYTQIKLQQAHDQIAASSAAFCATIKANPGMDQLPTLGWPAVAGSIPDSLKAMQAYEDRWTKLAKVSPAGIKPGVTRVAAAAKKIIDAVTVSRTVDDASNVAVMSSVASSSGVPAWHSEYCG